MTQPTTPATAINKPTLESVHKFICELGAISKGVASLPKLGNAAGITKQDAEVILEKMKTIPGISFVTTASGKLQSVKLSKIHTGCNSAVWNRNRQETTFYIRGVVVARVSDSSVNTLSKCQNELQNVSTIEGVPFLGEFCNFEVVARFYADIVFNL